MYCENCGNYLELDDKYCPRCGNKNPHYIKRKNNQIEDISQQSLVIKEEETKKKSKHINIRSIVVCLVLAIITVILVIGLRFEGTYDGDISIYMHEKVVEKSLQENVVTMTKVSQYYQMGRLYLEEDVYAFDKSTGAAAYCEYIPSVPLAGAELPEIFSEYVAL